MIIFIDNSYTFFINNLNYHVNVNINVDIIILMIINLINFDFIIILLKISKFLNVFNDFIMV